MGMCWESVKTFLDSLSIRLASVCIMGLFRNNVIFIKSISGILGISGIINGGRGFGFSAIPSRCFADFYNSIGIIKNLSNIFGGFSFFLFFFFYNILGDFIFISSFRES